MRCVLMLVVVTCLGGTAVAQSSGASTPPDEAHSLALSILQQTHQAALAQTMLHQMRGVMVDSITNAGKPRDQATAIVDQVLMPDLTARIGELMPAIADIWANNLSMEDLRAIRDFYASPAGQHCLAKLRLISSEAFQQIETSPGGVLSIV